MPEAHQFLLAVLHLRDEGGNVLYRPDIGEHPQHLLVGPAVQRAVQRGDRGRGRGERVGLGTADRAHRVCRTVLLVVGVQDEQNVEGVLEVRVRLVFELGGLPHHVQEVARVRQVVVRVDIGQPDRVPVGERGQGCDLCDEAHDL